MSVLPAIAVGIALVGQDAVPPAQAVETLPDVEVTASAREGAVRLECKVNSDRTLTDCVILSETPRGQGFGEAALAGARRARVSPGTFDEAAVGATVS